MQDAGPEFECSTCSRDLSDGLFTVTEHPVLHDVAICDLCAASFPAECASGSDDYCGWCGEADVEPLYLCDTCGRAFCHNCIGQNLGEQEADAVAAADIFCCYSCDPAKLYSLQRAHAAFRAKPPVLYEVLHDSTKNQAADPAVSAAFNATLFAGRSMEEAIEASCSIQDVPTAVTTSAPAAAAPAASAADAAAGGAADVTVTRPSAADTTAVSRSEAAVRLRQVASALDAAMSIQARACGVLDDPAHWDELKRDIATELRARSGEEPEAADIEADLQGTLRRWQTHADRAVEAVDSLCEKLDLLGVNTPALLRYLAAVYGLGEQRGSATGTLEGGDDAGLDEESETEPDAMQEIKADQNLTEKLCGAGPTHRWWSMESLRVVTAHVRRTCGAAAFASADTTDLCAELSDFYGRGHGGDARALTPTQLQQWGVVGDAAAQRLLALLQHMQRDGDAWFAPGAMREAVLHLRRSLGTAAFSADLVPLCFALSDYLSGAGDARALTREQLRGWGVVGDAAAERLRLMLRNLQDIAHQHMEAKLLPDLLPAVSAAVCSFWCSDGADSEYHQAYAIGQPNRSSGDHRLNLLPFTHRSCQVEHEMEQLTGAVDRELAEQRAQKLTLQVRAGDDTAASEVQQLLSKARRHWRSSGIPEDFIEEDEGDEGSVAGDGDAQLDPSLVVEDLGGDGPLGYDPSRRSQALQAPASEQEAEMLRQLFQKLLKAADEDIERQQQEAQQQQQQGGGGGAGSRGQVPRVLRINVHDESADKAADVVLRKRAIQRTAKARQRAPRRANPQPGPTPHARRQTGGTVMGPRQPLPLQRQQQEGPTTAAFTASVGVSAAAASAEADDNDSDSADIYFGAMPDEAIGGGIREREASSVDRGGRDDYSGGGGGGNCYLDDSMEDEEMSQIIYASGDITPRQGGGSDAEGQHGSGYDHGSEAADEAADEAAPTDDETVAQADEERDMDIENEVDSDHGEAAAAAAEAEGGGGSDAHADADAPESGESRNDGGSAGDDVSSDDADGGADGADGGDGEEGGAAAAAQPESYVLPRPTKKQFRQAVREVFGACDELVVATVLATNPRTLDAAMLQYQEVLSSAQLQTSKRPRRHPKSCLICRMANPHVVWRELRIGKDFKPQEGDSAAPGPLYTCDQDVCRCAAKARGYIDLKEEEAANRRPGFWDIISESDTADSDAEVQVTGRRRPRGSHSAADQQQDVKPSAEELDAAEAEAGASGSDGAGEESDGEQREEGDGGGAAAATATAEVEGSGSDSGSDGIASYDGGDGGYDYEGPEGEGAAAADGPTQPQGARDDLTQPQASAAPGDTAARLGTGSSDAADSDGEGGEAAQEEQSSAAEESESSDGSGSVSGASRRGAAKTKRPSTSSAGAAAAEKKDGASKRLGGSGDGLGTADVIGAASGGRGRGGSGSSSDSGSSSGGGGGSAKPPLAVKSSTPLVPSTPTRPVAAASGSETDTDEDVPRSTQKRRTLQVLNDDDDAADSGGGAKSSSGGAGGRGGRGGGVLASSKSSLSSGDESPVIGGSVCAAAPPRRRAPPPASQPHPDDIIDLLDSDDEGDDPAPAAKPAARSSAAAAVKAPATSDDESSTESDGSQRGKRPTNGRKRLHRQGKRGEQAGKEGGKGGKGAAPRVERALFDSDDASADDSDSDSDSESKPPASTLALQQLLHASAKQTPMAMCMYFINGSACMLKSPMSCSNLLERHFSRKAAAEEARRALLMQAEEAAAKAAAKKAQEQEAEERLDTDPNVMFSLEEGVAVRGRIAKHLKAHQREGVAFMYSSLVKSAEELKSEAARVKEGRDDRDSIAEAKRKIKLPGSPGGCILAHCMGLVVALLSAMLTSPALRAIKKPNDRDPMLATVLIVVPKNVIRNWEEEFVRWGVTGNDCTAYVLDLSEHMGTAMVEKRAEVLHLWHKGPPATTDRYGADSRLGRVLIMSYEALARFYTLVQTSESKLKDGQPLKASITKIKECLFGEGPDVLIADEGHLVRNNQSIRYKALDSVKTRRRALLTGSPLQNNLMEYYHMVSFVRPGLLGSEGYFKDAFSKPIDAGNAIDCSRNKADRMRRRVHVLRTKIAPFVHRRDSSVLIRELQRPPQASHRCAVAPAFKVEVACACCMVHDAGKPPAEYVIGVQRTPKQRDMERTIFKSYMTKNGKLSIFRAMHGLHFAWAHPELARHIIEHNLLLDAAASDGDEEVDDKDMDAKMQDALDRLGQGKRAGANGGGTAGGAGSEDEFVEDPEDDEDRAFIVDDDVVEYESDAEADDAVWAGEDTDYEPAAKPKAKRRKMQQGRRSSSGTAGSDADAAAGKGKRRRSEAALSATRDQRKKKAAKRRAKLKDVPLDLDAALDMNEFDVRESGKLVMLMEIVAQAVLVGDKVVVFSKYTTILNLLERLLTRSKGWGDAVSVAPPQGGGTTWGPWRPNRHYFRIDGSVSARDRQQRVNAFNKAGCKAHLFMVSTGAGSVGINLVAANRVVLLDTSWNPANDLQAMFRCYRFGQTKDVVVYRLLCHESAEEKIYMLQTSKRALAENVVDKKSILPQFMKSDKELGLNKYAQDGPAAEIQAVLAGLQGESPVVAAVVAMMADAAKSEVTSGLQNVLKRLQQAGGEADIKDGVLLRIVKHHTDWIKSCHQNSQLLQHDPDLQLRPEVCMYFVGARRAAL
ncbi:hypothetical protein JKP88DRAFT_267660 [Tribonema minus]|uniref:ATP-dependent helicase ATRX n=1 Tax=Tribonema minus TaxID=303371 RepID=A0A836CLW4_9STRA|nr:hypothetical protein JKP88DRAFT_267660 [Tribonema minus]